MTSCYLLYGLRVSLNMQLLYPDWPDSGYGAANDGPGVTQRY
jgi:hypothetical protein